MFRVIKWFLGFLVTLTVLILAAVVIVPMVFDPNDYRSEITELVKKQTGRELRLDGELKVSVFPWLGIRTEGLALSQPSEIGGDMISVDTAQLRVKFSPLLSKQVHIDTVVLTEPKLRLVTLKNGIDSFSGLTGAEDESQSDGAEQTSAAPAVALVIQGLELTEGNLVIDDRVAGTVTEVSKLNVVTGNLIGDSLADLSVSGVLKTSDSPDLVSFNMNGKAQINIDTLLVTMADLEAQVLLAENDIKLSLDSLSVADSAKLNVKGLKVVAGLVIPSDAEPGDQAASQARPIKAVVSAPQISANLDTQQAEVPALNIEAGSLKASLNNFLARDFIDAPSGSGKLSVPSFNAAKLLKEFDVDYQTTDPDALKNITLEADFKGSLTSAEVSNLIFTLDQSELKGSASVSDFDNPAARFNLTLNQLDVDRYLPPSTEEEEETVSGGDALAVPMAAFKSLQANGQFKAQTLTSGGVQMNNIDVQVRSTPGTVTITPTASLYDGSLAGQIAFTENQGTSKLAVKNEVDLVQLGKLLNAAEVTDQLSGVGSLLIDLVVTETNGVQTNNGVIKLQARDGAVQGVDIKAMVDSAYAQYQSLKGREPSKDQAAGKSVSSDETKFAELLGTFNVNNNIITNDDFSMKAPLFRVGGEGTIDVEKQVLDYLVEVKLVASTDGQGGEAIDALAGIPIPIRFTGSLTEPNYSIDFKRMYKALFAKEVDRKKGELLKEKLGIEGGENLSTKGVLRGILSNKIDKKLNKGKPQAAQGQESEPVGKERPLGERAPIGSEKSAVPDVSSTPESADGVAPDGADQQEPKSEKDRLKDELKNKLLDGLFGK